MSVCTSCKMKLASEVLLCCNCKRSLLRELLLLLLLSNKTRGARQTGIQIIKLSCALCILHSFPLHLPLCTLLFLLLFDVMCKSQTTALLFLLFVSVFVAAEREEALPASTSHIGVATHSTVTLKLCQLRALHAQWMKEQHSRHIRISDDTSNSTRSRHLAGLSINSMTLPFMWNLQIPWNPLLLDVDGNNKNCLFISHFVYLLHTNSRQANNKKILFNFLPLFLSTHTISVRDKCEEGNSFALSLSLFLAQAMISWRHS